MVDYKTYVEVLPELSHHCRLHHMEERKVWCRINSHGDIEDNIRVIRIEEGDDMSGLIVVAHPEVLEEWASGNETSMIQFFDFTRFNPTGPVVPMNPKDAMKRSVEDEVFFHYNIV